MCSLLLIFTLHWWLLAFSHFVTAVTKFSCCSSNKKMSPSVFLSLALNPCCPFSCWTSLACRPLSLFLCVSLAVYSKFVDMTIYLCLILQTTWIQKEFRLPLYWLFCFLCFTRHWWLCDFPPEWPWVAFGLPYLCPVFDTPDEGHSGH